MNKHSFIIPSDRDSSSGGHLSTPITDSQLTLALLKNLPLYREGISSILRGLEIGMAHGYFLIGPFYKLGPLRNSEIALLAGYLSTLGLIVILGLALTLYGTVTFTQSKEEPDPLMISHTAFQPNLDSLNGKIIFSGFPEIYLPITKKMSKLDPLITLEDEYKLGVDWKNFTGGFVIGAWGSAGFAFLLLSQFT